MDKCKFCNTNEAEICPQCAIEFIHATDLDYKPEDKSTHGGHKYGICKCGHHWFKHNRGPLMLFGLGGCDYCKCRIYRRMARMTYEEYQKFKEKNNI